MSTNTGSYYVVVPHLSNAPFVHAHHCRASELTTLIIAGRALFASRERAQAYEVARRMNASLADALVTTTVGS